MSWFAHLVPDFYLTDTVKILIGKRPTKGTRGRLYRFLCNLYDHSLMSDKMVNNLSKNKHRKEYIFI